MILHLFDDEKVVNRSISLFEEALPEQNIYVVNVKGKPVHVKEGNSVYFYTPSKDFDTSILKNVDKVIFHLLNEWKIDFINDFKITAKDICWAVWGHDMYNSILVDFGYNIYYEPGYVSPIKTSIFRLLHSIGIIHPATRRKLDFIRNRIALLKTSEEEYAIQKMYIGKYLPKNFTEVPSNMYYSIEDILGEDLVNKYVSGNMIMIGNSCSFSNNHLYAFKYLKKLNIDQKKIVVPLSYGGNTRYKDHVLSEGKRCFQDKFNPLLGFIPLDEYNTYLLNSPICIYGHWRQESVGNLIVSLYLGAKVFISKKSPLLPKYRKLGIHIFCLEDMTQSDIDQPLTKEQRDNNREILFRLYNHKNIVDGIKATWG